MILITGANGFLGQYVCRMLLDEGHPTAALVRDRAKLDGFDRRDELVIREGDLRDPVALDEAMKEIQVVIHCGAVVSFDPADCDVMRQTNVDGTRHLVNTALHHQVEYFIHISSVAALGRIASSGTVDETARWQDSKWNTCYGESKYQSELEVWRGISEGLRAVILNPSVIIGRPVPGAISNRLFEFVEEKHHYYPTGNLNYVDVRDVCRMISGLLSKRPVNERFIVSAEAMPYQEFFVRAAEKMELPPPKKPAGNFILRLAMIGDFLRKVFTGRKRAFTRETLRLSKTKIYFSNEKARRELNFTFAPLSETLTWILGDGQKE